MHIQPGETIASFPKSSGKEVRASVDTIGGKLYVNLRVFYRSAEGWKPSQQGLVLSVDRIADLVNAVGCVAQHLANGTDS